jgi:hypothetical protein
VLALRDPNLPNNAENEEHRRATIESDGCHWVLIVLRQELDKGEGGADGADRRVVDLTLRFGQLWNNCFEGRAFATRRDAAPSTASEAVAMAMAMAAFSDPSRRNPGSGAPVPPQTFTCDDPDAAARADEQAARVARTVEETNSCLLLEQGSKSTRIWKEQPVLGWCFTFVEEDARRAVNGSRRVRERPNACTV